MLLNYYLTMLRNSKEGCAEPSHRVTSCHMKKQHTYMLLFHVLFEVPVYGTN